MVGEDGLDVLVPGDQVNLHPERIGDGSHTHGLSDVAQFRHRVERVAPHVHGW